jgi:tight adherence protein C
MLDNKPTSTESATSPTASRGQRPGGKGDAGRVDTPFERVLRNALERRTRETSFFNRVVHPALQKLADKSGALTDNVDSDAVRYRLMSAGFPRGLRARDFVLLKLISLLVMPLLAWFYIPIICWLAGWDILPLYFLWGGLIFAWFGFRLPDIWLSVLTRKRQMEIQLILPDMIDLITISVEAGLGLYAAIQRVSQKFENALAEEFLRSLQEVRLGRTNTEAMRDLLRRVDVDDLSMFISSLIQAETLGVPIANVLRAQSERLRDKRRQRAREQAQKAPLKMLFPLAIFIFPALGVVILGPVLLKVLESGM